MSSQLRGCHVYFLYILLLLLLLLLAHSHRTDRQTSECALVAGLGCGNARYDNLDADVGTDVRTYLRACSVGVWQILDRLTDRSRNLQIRTEPALQHSQVAVGTS